MGHKMPLARPQRRQSDSAAVSGHRWTFERRISLDTIVGVAGIAFVLGGPLILAWRAMDSRILTMEVKDEARMKNDDKRDIETREFKNTIGGQLSKISEQTMQLQIAIGVLSGKLPSDGRK